MMDKAAKIYLRKNGSFGASCDGILDTAHEIQEDSGRFTVWSASETAHIICQNATRDEAEAAIAADWRAA